MTSKSVTAFPRESSTLITYGEEKFLSFVVSFGDERTVIFEEFALSEYKSATEGNSVLMELESFATELFDVFGFDAHEKASDVAIAI